MHGVISHLPVMYEITFELLALSEINVLFYQEFNKGNYDGCLSSMNKLVNTRGLDPKVIMNKAVVEFYNSRFSQTDDLRQALDIACTKVYNSFKL